MNSLWKKTKSLSAQTQRRQLKKDKKHQKKLNKAAIRAQKAKKTELIYQIHTTITHHFPELFDWMRELDDPRKKASQFELAAHFINYHKTCLETHK